MHRSEANFHAPPFVLRGVDRVLFASRPRIPASTAACKDRCVTEAGEGALHPVIEALRWRPANARIALVVEGGACAGPSRAGWSSRWTRSA